jgi:hypothetical protein
MESLIEQRSDFSVLLGNGAGNFSSIAALLAPSIHDRSMTVADLNGDASWIS